MRPQGPPIASPAVSSVLTATPGAGPADTSTADRAQSRSGRPSPDVLAALLIAAAIVALAMISGGGVDNLVATPGNTWSEIAVTVLGAVTVSVVVVIGPPGRHWGLLTILLMATLTILEVLSITWSYLPDSSWLASSQAVSFLAAFAAAVCLAWVAPNRWPALLGGFAIAMTALCGWSLLVKVFPATLASSGTPGRLEAPFGYWNAIGLCAALGLPACLWSGARRERGRLVAGLAAPALCLLLSVAVLSYSRSADAACLVAVALWLVFVPLRLRSVVLLAIGATGAAVISAWMLTHGPLKSSSATLGAQDHAGHTFGIVIAAVLVVVTASGFWAARAMDRTDLPAALRRRIGWGLIALLAVGVVCALGATAVSSRGLTGELSHVWTQLTATDSHVSDSAAGRVFEFGSSRPTYWHQAISVGEHSLLKGVGLLGFGDARLRYTTSGSVVSEAHGYLFETFADLGLIGVVVTLALLVSWLVAAWRTLAPRTRAASLDPARSVEREGMVALAAIVIAFGVQSTLDWTWFFSGVTVPVLLCAGWLAGRGPLTQTVAAADPSIDDLAAERDPVSANGWFDRLARRPASAAVIVVLLAGTLAIGWMQWRPLRSAQQLSRSESASTSASAFSAARDAASSDPLSIEPLTRLGNLYLQLGDHSAAHAEFVKAKNLQPQNPTSWFNLANGDYFHGHIAESLPEYFRTMQLDHTPDTTRVTALAAYQQGQAAIAAAHKAAG
jgi:cytochrome c-type biogenesis protein CcmH/NrfG